MHSLLAITDQSVIHIATITMIVSAKVAGPILLISLALGLGISLLQSVTQIQEVTLTFVPKLAGVALVIVLAGNWMLNTLVEFTRQLFDLIPSLIGS
jgi:flagellar biosynthetic protein FliQ